MEPMYKADIVITHMEWVQKRPPIKLRVFPSNKGHKENQGYRCNKTPKRVRDVGPTKAQNESQGSGSNKGPNESQGSGSKKAPRESIV